MATRRKVQNIGIRNQSGIWKILCPKRRYRGYEGRRFKHPVNQRQAILHFTTGQIMQKQRIVPHSGALPRQGGPVDKSWGRMMGHGRITRAMSGGIQTAVGLIYPPQCLACGELVETEFALCGRCWRDTPFISGTVCDTCGVPLPGDGDGDRLSCDDCLVTARPWGRGRAALAYRGGGRGLVLALKHGDRTEIARPAAQWMARAAEPILEPDMVLAPVPLHWMRLIRRRYNQSALLSRELARITGLAHCPDLLIRRRRTPSLDRKPMAQRFATLQNAIAPHPRRLSYMAGKAVLLIDDVMTSGATLAACAEACRAAGARDVFALVLARVAKED